MSRRILLGMLVFLVACSALKPAPPPTPTPTRTPAVTGTASPVPSATPRSTPTATATNPPTPTSTFTPSPVPSATFTPLPSPTPNGYYTHQTAGFNLIYPTQWSVVSEDDASLVLGDDAGLILLIQRNTEPGNPTFQAQVDEFIKLLNVPYTFKQSPADSINLADGVTAQTALLTGTDSKSRKWTAQFSLALAGDRRYWILVFGQSQVVASRSQTLTQVLAGLHLTHDVYGLPRQQTLVLAGFDATAKALDPALTHGGADGYVGLLFSGLVRLSPQLQIQPDLAESWVASATGDVYTFTVRPRLTFQSGAPLTAASVKYSWERAVDPKTKSDTAATYLGDIAGVKEMLAGKADHISGLTVVDDQTLVVQLVGPRPYFLAELTYPTGFIVDSKNVASSPDNWMFHPNASGPYSIKENRAGVALILERNPAFYAQVAIPYVVFRENLAVSGFEAYQTGDVDVSGVGGSADLARVHSSTDPLHAEAQSATNMCTIMLMLDVSKPPLDDPDVRQALALALDRDTLFTRLVQGGAIRANTILPPGMPGYATDLPRFAFDASAAKAALARSRYAGKMPELVVNESGQGGQPSAFLTAVADMWRQNLGLTVRIKQLDPSAYSAAARQQHGNVLTYGWCADYPDPENFLDILFHTGGDFNVSGYSDPQIDTWLDAARTEVDGTKRLALYHQVESKLLGDVAVIPWINDLSDVVVKPYVKGYILPPMSVATLRWLSLDYGGSN